jgi:sucrose-6F-phosphate phosphohydrolase
MAGRLLATDLDGTFIGDDAAMHALWRDLEDSGIILAFSTGRHLASIHDFYAERQVTRRADACICMVGTEIWIRSGSGYHLDHDWSRRIVDAWSKDAVDAVVAQIDGAVRQPDEWQSPLKSSYYLDSDDQLPRIRERLSEEGLQAKVVYSAGRFLDLLPHRSGKGEAVRYLAGLLDIRPDDVITCGDTGNDLDMMRPEMGFRSVAVGNATAELAAYTAPSIYHASQPFAAGIREGLVHWGWLT